MVVCQALTAPAALHMDAAFVIHVLYAQKACMARYRAICARYHQKALLSKVFFACVRRHERAMRQEEPLDSLFAPVTGSGRLDVGHLPQIVHERVLHMPVKIIMCIGTYDEVMWQGAEQGSKWLLHPTLTVT